MEEHLVCSVCINAPRSRVWHLVSDLQRMSSWSPQVDRTRWTDGASCAALGARFVNDNRHGELRWTTHGEVVRFVPERGIAFRIAENWVIWGFSMVAAEPSTTQLIQTRETPEGISPTSLRLTEAYLGGVEHFTAVMRAGMKATLSRIKAEAEASDH